MNKNILYFLFLLSLSSLIHAQQIAISGTVTRSDASAIQGVTVVLENNGTPADETVTDALGNYALSVNAGSYTALRVRNMDTEIAGIPSTIEHTAFSNLNPSKDTTIDITMPAYINIYGKVYDADSTALASAQLVIKKWDGSEGTPWDKDVSTGDGSYSLYMKSGGVKFWITPSGGQEVTMLDTFTASTSFNIYLPKLVTLSGTVTSFNGDTLRSITVAMEKGAEQYEASTDANGFYTKTVNPGNYRIRLRNGVSGVAEGVPSTMEETIIDTLVLNNDSTVNLATQFYPALRCSVVNTAGVPVPNVGTTSKQWQGSEMPPWDSDTTNAAGICQLYVFNGNNKVWVYPPADSDFVESSFEISVTSDTTIPVILNKGVSLYGKVFRADSTPVSGISVALEKDADQWMETTDGQGIYLFKMQPGTYRLRVRNMNSVIAGIPSTLEHTVQETLSLTIPDTIDIYLPLFPTISGIIMNPSGSPVSGTHIVVKRWEGAEMPPWDEYTTIAGGAYSVTVGAGTNKIWLTPPGGSGLGAFSFIETFDKNTTKDIYIPEEAKGITRFQPSVITRGNSGEIMINGIGADFTSGTVTIDLGANIAVSNIQAVSSISLLADITIDSTAETGCRNAKVSIGSETLIGPNLLNVTAKVKDTIPLDGSNKTTREILISDGAGTELRIPVGTEVEFPQNVDEVIGYESPILQGGDPVISNGGLLEVQKKLEPSGVVFKDTVYMTVQYKDQDVEGLEEIKIIPYFYFDSDTGTGVLGDTMIVIDRDTAANTIVFALPHFSMFRLATGKASIGIIPSEGINVNRTQFVSITKPGKFCTFLSFYVSQNDAKKEIVLRIFDLKGRIVRTLIKGVVGKGHHTVQWDSRGNAGKILGNGFYILNLKVGNKSNCYKNIFIVR